MGDLWHCFLVQYSTMDAGKTVTSRLDVAAEMVMTVGFPGAQISGTVRLVT